MAEGELIIGDSNFGFELDDVAEARRVVADNVRVQAEMLADENEGVRRVAESLNESVEQDVAFFEVHDDETILGGLRYVFERGKELEAVGLSAKDVATTIGNEIPDLSRIGGLLLERQPWGYSLNQKVTAAAIDS